MRFDFLTVEAEVRGEKIHARVGGLLGETVQQYAEKFFNTLNSLKVIARRDGALVYNLYNPPQPTPAGMRALLRKVKELVFKMPFPATANLAVTHKCQCRCVHCSADPFVDKARRELSTEELKEVVDGALDLGANIVIFTGGEPILRPDLPELIRYVDKSKAQVMIFTNGQYLTEQKVKELAEAGLATLNISIDHVEPEVHDRLRGVRGLFDMAVQGARHARKAGILTGISTYATHENLADGSLERLLAFAQQEGFNETTVFDCIPSGRFLKHTEYILSDAERAKVIELCMRYHRMDHPMGVLCMSLINSPQGGGCFGAYSQFYMTAYGDINPCDFNPISFGNVRDLPVQAIWHKMVSHPDFACRHLTCRMQTPSYRAKYIDVLPEDSKLPVPIEYYMHREQGRTAGGDAPTPTTTAGTAEGARATG